MGLFSTSGDTLLTISPVMDHRQTKEQLINIALVLTPVETLGRQNAFAAGVNNTVGNFDREPLAPRPPTHPNEGGQ
jgi:hypothetical protein